MRKFLAILIVTLVTAGCSGSESNSLFSALAGGSSGSGSSGSSSALAGGSGSGSAGSGSPGGAVLPHSPEPSTVALLATGLAAFALAALRKRKKQGDSPQPRL